MIPRAGKLTDRDLRRELADYRERYPKLGDDELFVLWFLRAFVTENEAHAVEALCSGSRDKGVDAVLIDEPAKIVFVVQGKYRKGVAEKSENRSDIISFAELARPLDGNGHDFGDFVRDASPEVAQRLTDARKRLHRRSSFSLQLFYVTTGKCSPSLEDEARRIVRSVDIPASFEFFNGKRILLLLADYLDGVAPPVPTLDLEIESGQGVKSSGILNRYDTKTDIESWVFTMTDDCVAGLFERAGTRLFARNVRGFLGSTPINRGMENTLAKEPEYFWYYNNGVTIICDDAKREIARGRDILRVMNPQVINGQQTTRTLARRSRRGSKASVLVRVIRVPRDGDGAGDQFDSLVTQIVSATNWQNAIKPSDLMSNDRRQIEIERQFRKLGYLYLRKRMKKGEARRASGTRHHFIIRKDELAQAVAACDLDPWVVREGKEGLFEERLYPSVFPSAEPNYYLARYWLFRQVGYTARGKPERAYAKWLVLNFVWQHMAPEVRARARAETFRSQCEKDDGYVLNPLIRAIDAVFVAALRFYRGKRGKGATAIDVSTFFKRKNLHKEFTKFWRGPQNKSRRRFQSAWKNFKKALAEEVAA